MVTLQFLGGAGTTTGSRFLLTQNGRRTLVDCGLFQGLKEIRQLNWERFPVDPSSIHEVLLTHAHIDHSGYLPRLARQGFSRTVHATAATSELAEIMLRDSAEIQEEDAAYANKRRYSRHHPALPLYTVADAEKAIQLLKSHPYETAVTLAPNLSFLMRDAGHILGSATVELRISTQGRTITVLFSGDLGRSDTPIIRDPAPVARADFLVLESTYGNRLHEAQSPAAVLEAIINETAGRGGSIVIPSFAVGRAQTLLYLLRELREQRKIPSLPIYLDSPMALDTTNVFRRHPDAYDSELLSLKEEGKSPFAFPGLRLIRSAAESKSLNSQTFPCIIISSSGMATSGRVLHHLQWRLPDPRNAVLLVGYQAAGTRGQRLLRGERHIKIHGEMVPVRATVHNIGGLSAHADYREILAWLRNFQQPPTATFIVHGEPESSAGLAGHIEKELGWKTHLPKLGEKVSLGK